MYKPALYTLITGASEGFGKSLAIECARHGMNLILVALPGPELSGLSVFIKRNYPVNVITIGKDLCKDESCQELFNEVNALPAEVKMIINNAGTGSTLLFEEGSIGLYENQIKLNVLATTLITKLFLDQLKKNRPSYILNIGSMASFFYLSKKQVYGATKSFIYFFSKALHTELKTKGIHVSVLCPGGMNTNLDLTLMNKRISIFSRMSVLNPEAAASIALQGLLKRQEVIIPGRINQFFFHTEQNTSCQYKKILTGKAMNKIKPVHSVNQYLSYYK